MVSITTTIRYSWEEQSLQGVVLGDPEDTIDRRCTILMSEGEEWLVDPIDSSLLRSFCSDVGGILVTTTHHWRDAVELAGQYDVPIEIPPWFRSPPDRAERVTDPSLASFSFLPVSRNAIWQETALWNGTTLITGDAVSTSDWIGPEPVSLYPYLWFRPPAWTADLEAERLICGHGDPVDDIDLRFDPGQAQYPDACYRIARMVIRGL